MSDLRIYYSSLSAPHYIDCLCTRWDYDDYGVIVETWLTKSQLNTLRNHIVAGATDVLYQIVGYAPNQYDSTWNGENTIKLSALDTGSETLSKMRGRDVIGYVKHISESPVEGNCGYIATKLELNISGTTI